MSQEILKAIKTNKTYNKPIKLQSKLKCQKCSKFCYLKSCSFLEALRPTFILRFKVLIQKASRKHNWDQLLLESSIFNLRCTAFIMSEFNPTSGILLSEIDKLNIFNSSRNCWQLTACCNIGWSSRLPCSSRQVTKHRSVLPI